MEITKLLFVYAKDKVVRNVANKIKENLIENGGIKKSHTKTVCFLHVVLRNLRSHSTQVSKPVNKPVTLF